ncbi:helix-hairpin-helix domain-containing protein [Kocuria rhizophila]|uniref:helix-hairpin-helix domain-containing protein n=1 Tax=Kocuria rhizophila TaxID=72000 RepID=UPI00294A9FDB|nr:helix-hairpin-helix domain-containing protein [Kocuria rhizophila]
MSGIDFRGRRRFRDSPATERLAALLGEDETSGATGETALPGDRDPAGEPPAEDAHSRHREDVLVRRRLSRPAVVVLCAVLLLAVVLGGMSLLLRGDDAAVVTSAAVSGGGAGASDDDGAASGDGAGAGESSGASGHGRTGATSHASPEVAKTSNGATAGAQDTGVLTVHVVGEVKDPSVVTLSPGARVMDAVQAAGGFTSAAVKDRLNLAQTVQDGAQIMIPNKGNADRVAAEQSGGAASSSGSAADNGSGAASAAGGTGGASGAAGGGSGGIGAGAGKASRGAAAGGTLVNLNTATAAELETLPRVGPVLAQRIVDFRTQHGPFTAPEQLDDVSGVGPTMLEALLPLVTV